MEGERTVCECWNFNNSHCFRKARYDMRRWECGRGRQGSYPQAMWRNTAWDGCLCCATLCYLGIGSHKIQRGSWPCASWTWRCSTSKRGSGVRTISQAAAAT